MLDIELTEVNFDGLEDMDESELRDLVRQFREAQASNIQAVEDAQEEFDEIGAEISELRNFKDQLAEEIAEASVLQYDEVVDRDLDRIRELHAEFVEDGTADAPAETGDEGGTDADFGQRGQTHTDGDDDEIPDYVERVYDDISGLHL